MVKTNELCLEIKPKIIKPTSQAVDKMWFAIPKSTVWNIVLKIKKEKAIANKAECGRKKKLLVRPGYDLRTVENNLNITTKDLWNSLEAARMKITKNSIAKESTCKHANLKTTFLKVTYLQVHLAFAN